MPQLKECRVLILEDEILLAMDVEDLLREAGCVHLMWVATVADALESVGARRPDVAILDLNVNGEKSFPVADALNEAGVPFVIVSGHSRTIVPARHGKRPFLGKPYDRGELLRVVQHMVDTTEPGRPAAS